MRNRPVLRARSPGVEAGGTVSNAYGYIGYTFGSTGVATVTGTGSTWACLGELNIGLDGNGSILSRDRIGKEKCN